MKTQNIFIALVLVLTIRLQFSTACAQNTLFTYQGQLMDGGSLANGKNYGMVFYLYDAPTNGNLLGNEGIVSVTVSNGLFTVPLDFGNEFDGNARWLEIAVQKNGGGFTTLAPRQPVTPAPYSIYANTASNLSGTIPLAQLPPGVVTNGASGVNLAGTFSGNGSGLTNLNNNVALLNGTNVFSGSNAFTGIFTATKWKATTVMDDEPGPLPLTGSFKSSGGTLLISVSGSAYVASPNYGVFIGTSVYVDGVFLNNCYIYANSYDFHMAFVPKTFVAHAAAGSHSITLQNEAPYTTTDSADNFTVTVEELPF
jgi:hypothetical protein